MGNLQYGRWSDNAARLATVTVQTGAEDSNYPAANLVDGNPAKPAKLTGTTGAWQLDLGAAYQIDAVALIHHNLTAGLANVLIQGNSSASWASPPLSQAFTIPAYHGDGMPVNPFLDLTGVGTRTYRYWRLIFGTANGAAIAIGEVVMLVQISTLPVNISWGAQIVEQHPIVEHRTPFGTSMIYQIGTKWRTLTGQIESTTDVGLAALQALERDVGGRAKPFLALPFGSGSNDAWLVRLTESQLAYTETFLNAHSLQLGLEEVPRGLPL